MLPNFVYRVDSRPPEIIFAEGFKMWGDNYDLSEHIAGGSNIGAWAYGTDPDDGYISTSASDIGSIQYLRNSDSESSDLPGQAWIYEIRPTQDFYNLINNSRHYINLIRTNQITFIRPESEERVLATLELAERFQFEEEWFSVNNIGRELIVSARRIDLLTYQRGGLVTINREIFNNPHYQQGPSNPNPGIFIHQDVIDPNITDVNIILQDNHQGNLASGGFLLCSPFSESKQIKNSKYHQAIFVKNKIKKFRGKEVLNYKATLSKPLAQDIPIIKVNSKVEGNLWLQDEYAIRNHYGAKDWPWIYDQDGCIGFWLGNNKFLFYCLTAADVDKTKWQYIIANPKLKGELTQQWDLILDKQTNFISLVNRKYPQKIIGTHWSGSKDYLIIRDKNAGKEIANINFAKLSDKNIFIPSYTGNTLEWFDLRWQWQGTTYYPSLSGSSYQKHDNAQIVFYKEFNYILYIQPRGGRMWALTNRRNVNDDWNWIKWEEINKDEFKNLPVNPRRMWKVKKVEDNYNVEINSFWNDDILWIQTHSTNWGSYFTSRKTSDYWKVASRKHLADYSYYD